MSDEAISGKQLLRIKWKIHSRESRASAQKKDEMTPEMRIGGDEGSFL